MRRPPQVIDNRQALLRFLLAAPLALVFLVLGFRKAGDEATEVEEFNPADAADARVAEADGLLAANRASAAERVLRECLEFDPHHADAHERLAWLLTIEGRRFESLAHVYEVLRHQRFTVSWLTAAGNHDEAVGEEPRLRAFRSAEPDSVLPLLGLARIELLNKKNRAEARRLLEVVLAAEPEQVEGRALMGLILWDERDRSALADWLEHLPAACDAHPDVWLVRGYLAKETGDVRSSARCFWEALRRDSNHRKATFQLFQALRSLRADQGDIDFLARRAHELQEFVDTLFDMRIRPNERRLFQRAAALCESLGRPWEAWGWNVVAGSPPAGAGPIPTLGHHSPLTSSPDATLAECDPGRRLDMSSYSLPAFAWIETSPGETAQDAPAPNGMWSTPAFRERAELAGIDFQYFRGCEPGDGDARMFQFTGGGVAVLDFDLDGWPDLYFAQGCRWPPRAGQTEFLDQLFRNLDGRFRRATNQAGIIEDRFSQGVTVGDFDSDGFPDLYVANIGVNRLLLNCGDGSFLDVSPSAGLTDESWTTSCLMADLNGDGLPDIYDVNYVAGYDLFEQVCEQGGVRQTCSPRTFLPAPDRMWLNLGDGRFEDRTESSGLSVPGGNGLGVVAADFDDSGHLSLFVANDQDADFYFVNQGTAVDRLPRFAELGVLSGLAFDGQGKAQASMGVAADDANGDGRLDLFVTDFYRMASALYVQRNGDLFEEVAATAGLQAASYEMLGFGTQFLDGELDGLPDLVVTNGHLDDLRALGTPYRMRTQYFRNLGRGRFAEVDGERLGEFFRQLHLGRALARLDFNRDGREDFVVTHLDEPAALLSNETKQAGHFLALILHGTGSSRDAVGMRVTARAGGTCWTRQLTAGDGYMASNERQLVFGLGACASVDEITVRWPSGAQQAWHDVPADTELILVEGCEELVPLPQ